MNDNDNDKQAQITAYADRKTAKVERLNSRAEKARADSIDTYKRSNAITENIPLGQPILVDHYSANRHRNALAKSNALMGKSIELDKKAERLESRAASALSDSSIRSDDPQAIEKLKAKRDRSTEATEMMKAANKIIRSAPKNVETPEKIAKLIELGLPEAERTFKPNFLGGIGFESYAFSNMTAERKRLQQRIDILEKSQANPTSERQIGAVRIERNVEDNRIRLFFPGKPDDETRSALKSGGFRWSPRFQAWQAYLGGQAERRADRLAALWEGAASV